MKPVFFTYILFIFLVSCSSDRTETQTFYHGFSNNTWEIDQVVSFSFDIADTAAHYDVTGKMRIGKAFTFSTFDMNLVLLTPSGSSRYKKVHLQMRNESGERTGNLINNYYEIPFSVYDSVRFAESGKWVMNFDHNMPVDIYEGMIGLEVFVEKQK